VTTGTVVALHAGLAGIAQDGDGALRPVAGWHLAPAEVHAVYDRIGSAELFGGGWRLLPVTQHRQAWTRNSRRFIPAVIDLAAGHLPRPALGRGSRLSLRSFQLSGRCQRGWTTASGQGPA
jgi:hypothetical protein